MKILVTGAAGFIGFHTAKRLIERGDEVVGYDAVNDYYDPALKQARLAILEDTAAAAPGHWTFLHADLADRAAVNAAFAEYGFGRVIHLAAQAGVPDLQHRQQSSSEADGVHRGDRGSGRPNDD
jgi:UDP-glucuronate 4-epimerase